MFEKHNLTKYVNVVGVGFFGLFFSFFPQDQSALYRLCNSISTANKIIWKAELTFSLFQGPS